MTNPLPLSKLIHWSLTLAGYGFYSAGALFFFILILPVAMMLAPFGNLSQRFLHFTTHWYLGILTRTVLPALGVYKIKELSGFDGLPPVKPMLFVANHRGKIDGPLLLGLLKNTVSVMKMKYASLPLYAALVKRLDFISLNPYSHEALEQTLQRAKEVLAKGKNLLIFPEGTRSNSRRLLPFKELAFHIAKEMDLYIVPVVIHSELAFMVKQFRSFFPDNCFSIRVRCLKPIKALPDEEPDSMAARVQKIMAKELAFIEASYQSSERTDSV